MLDLVDLLLLRRGIPADDQSLALRRIDGNPSSRAIYFLPWHTPYAVARQAGFLPLDFLACYEMPAAIVSSEPQRCIDAVLALAEDTSRTVREHGLKPRDALIIGLSVGSFPATFIANNLGARLCSVASADRVDLTLWESPASRIVKRRALLKGRNLQDYSAALAGFHPAENLSNLGPGSLFVFGRRDPFVPSGRANGLLRAIQEHSPPSHIVRLDAGHVGTLILSAHHQCRFAGIERVPSRWTYAIPRWRLRAT